MLDAGCTAPLIGDFHYNGHLLPTCAPACAAALDKYRINPQRRTGSGATSNSRPACRVASIMPSPCASALTEAHSIRIWSSRRCRRTPTAAGKAEAIINECAVLSAIESTAPVMSQGLRGRSDHHREHRLRDLMTCTALRQTDQLPHLDRPKFARVKGLVWSASAMGVLLAEGIGDTIRAPLTPRPGGDRREEVRPASRPGARSALFFAGVTACLGWGTTARRFRNLPKHRITCEKCRSGNAVWR